MGEMNRVNRRDKKISRRVTLIALMGMLCIMSVLLTGCGDPEKKAAKKSFNSELDAVNSLLDDRAAEVKKANESLELKDKALDDTIKPALKDACNKASEDVNIPNMPSETDEINAKVKTLKSIEDDLNEQINDVKNMETELDKSRKQYKLLVNPDKKFIVERLKKVKNVDKVAAVTEDNDPNGNLNKPGGYTAQIYFSSPLVQDDIFTGDVIEDGTDGGGSIEVYKTVSEANKRNDYLAGFDGGFLASGSHAVYGTIIIRTSSELTASQQKNLEKEILTELTKLSK